ncbi:uncharacterized protein LOC128744354 [Sabethes cyaneus]|uniref:uncharacterized protein LOC128744354 n=1 Tax=Sabethes cyaneus TaxID=53552 RepID=UPI00237D91AF|nr:uncharacterized protein LOC128744354 [Sabethes cyaneus]
MPPATTSKGKPPTLNALQKKLKGLQTSFNNVHNFIKECSEATKASEFSVRLERLELLWDKMNDTIDEIECHEENVDVESPVKERVDFENRFFELKAFLIDRLKNDPEAAPLNQSVRPTEPLTTHAKLPQISLPKFGGKIEEWLNFRDLYMSLIHLQPDLPEVEKFHYLRSQLEGEALNLINTLPLTKTNYMVAWDMLVQRYSNTKILKKKNVQALFELPSIRRESAEEMHSLLESFEATVKSLDHTIDQQGDYKDLLLLHMLSSRLDSASRRSWEDFSSSKEHDTIKDLTGFMRRRIHMLEAISTKPDCTKAECSQPNKRKLLPTTKSCNVVLNTASSKRCLSCSDNHPLYLCPVFKNMQVQERDNLLRTNSLCRNCFRRGHQAKDCSSKYVCRHCRGKHHSLVCFKENGKPIGSTDTSRDTATRSADAEAAATSNNTVHAAAAQVTSYSSIKVPATGVLLLTAVVVVQDESGSHHLARALLDCACQCDLVSKRFSQLLKSKRQSTNMDIIGVNGKVEKITNFVNVTIKSRVTNYQIPVELNIHPCLSTTIPGLSPTANNWNLPEGIQLADPSLFESHKVDLILGGGSFFDFFRTGRRIPLGKDMPLFVDSVFGWVASGKYPVVHNTAAVSCNVAVTNKLEELLTRFWQSEEIGLDNKFSPGELRCEEHFQQTFKRDAAGRYSVSLPKDEAILQQLGHTQNIACYRFHQMERRLERDPELKRQYHNFMLEYEQLGHMRRVPDEDVTKIQRFYLPHHPVVKDSSSTTRVRVVFDASCKSSSGVSLNDALLAGPVVQEDLRSIILRCRTRLVLLVADVEKMFRQINIDKTDAPLQSILWRSTTDSPPATYELSTVTYGTKSAPFLATRTLKQLALDEGKRFPLAAAAVMKDFYVDDVITGTDDAEQAKELRCQLDELLQSGGMRLRKWSSNYASVLEGLKPEDLADSVAEGIKLDRDPSVKTLGLTWYPQTDAFALQLQIPSISNDQELTKRKVLSYIAMLFDPLGLIGAVITTAKIFMQTLWQLEDDNQEKLDWDSVLPTRVENEWRTFHEQLPILKQLRVERMIIIPGSVGMEVHCFSDASGKAYGANLYIKSWNSAGHVKVALLSSKSRVAPLKTQSIPRLELCGALMAAELFVKVKEAIDIEGDVYFWTDSTTVLRWLQALPTIWTTFVANRVAKIQNITERCLWKHVPGTQNPADMTSRGIFPESIIKNRVWWEGPEWLAFSIDKWPVQHEITDSTEADQEFKRSAVGAVGACNLGFNDWYFARFSEYTTLIRQTAYCQRFIKNFRVKLQIGQSVPGPITALTAPELRTAELTVTRLVQQEAFSKEYRALSQGKAIPRHSPLRWFYPVLSHDGVIRLGGRLGRSQESEEARHPMVLPARHHLTKLLLKHYHLKLLHAGPQLMLSSVRQKFWPLGGRSVAKQIIHQCLRCSRVKPATMRQFMAELPASRVTAAKAFSTTGVDYFGPIYIRPGYRRTAVKAYVSVFVCFTTKAVHLELVGNLSTACFIQALRRFVARRGFCSSIHSDNGTNFVGARNQLKELMENLKSKHHLLRVLGEIPVSYEDMLTTLTQVEACLNSRPLTQLTDDPNDLEPLTPGHFLVGDSLQAVPDTDFTNVPANRLNHWQAVQKKVQDFWRRWRVEYLTQLQGRSKRWQPPVAVEPGKLVVIQEDNVPPIRWRMGRIQHTHPGADGVVRVVTLKTAKGVFQRPVEKICLLPVATVTEDGVPQI